MSFRSERPYTEASPDVGSYSPLHKAPVHTTHAAVSSVGRAHAMRGSRQHVNGRRFTSTVVTQERAHLTFVDVKVKAIHRPDRALATIAGKLFSESPDLDARSCGDFRCDDFHVSFVTLRSAIDAR